VDFIRSYADRCHHGKEEDILFRDLEAKPLEEPYKQILRELTQEHVHGRQVTRQLEEATLRYRQGEEAALGDLSAAAGELAAFYPRHIEKEDRHFFVPVMECFSKKEQAAMLQRFHEFDRQLIHERYRGAVSHWEAQPPAAGKP
jgi:hemerythrin-like domain-containing protein